MKENSETFKLVSNNIDSGEGYSSPVLLRETSGAKLYRVKKAGKYFIIKIPADSGMFLDLIKREYNLSLGLSHPNIINIFTFESASPVGPGIVMEYIDGQNLSDWLSNNNSIRTRKRVFAQILDAVEYIHKSSIIHNDIKPDNIMITRVNSDVKLIDFGLSDDDANFMFRNLGCTPNYASPELFNHTKSIDVRSDIYSIGVMMQDLFGKKYSAISKKCRQTNPDDRYKNIEELRKAFYFRNNKWKYASTLITILIILASIIIPSSLYLNNKEKYDEYVANIENIESATKRHINYADSILINIYNSTIDSISNHPYSKSLRNAPANFIASSTLLIDSMTAKIDNPKVKFSFLDHVEKQQYVLNQQLEISLSNRIEVTKQNLLDKELTHLKRQYLLTTDSINKTSSYNTAISYIVNNSNSKWLRTQSLSKSLSDDREINNYVIEILQQEYNEYYNNLIKLCENKKD